MSLCCIALDDASQYNDNDIYHSDSCSACGLGQSCQGAEVCKDNFCSVSLDDDSQCNDNDVCPSNSCSDSDCSLCYS